MLKAIKVSLTPFLLFGLTSTTADSSDNTEPILPQIKYPSDNDLTATAAEEKLGGAFIDEDLARNGTYIQLRGLDIFHNTDILPGYIETYYYRPPIPENMFYCYIFVGPETGVTSLEELYSRAERAYKEVYKDIMYVEELEPGYGKWGPAPYDISPADADRIHEIIYGMARDLSKRGRELYPISHGAVTVCKDYGEIDFGHGVPEFISEYYLMESVAKEVFGTDDVELGVIYLLGNMVTFNSDEHTVYIKYEAHKKYYIDDAVDLIFPGLHSGNLEPGYYQNPDGTPKYSEENRAYWSGIEKAIEETE
ncbi:MAG: hypothetical protein JSW52_11740 [Candidatus Coatesbacteria bacterium]|nr:MAG: hypothetical protein JSW52_11740 [Candidatus Coatesbacteria bacterium]